MQEKEFQLTSRWEDQSHRKDQVELKISYFYSKIGKIEVTQEAKKNKKEMKKIKKMMITIWYQ